MPAPGLIGYRQKLTYWVPSASGDGYGGDAGYGAPVVIPCRWEDHYVEALSGAYRQPGEIAAPNALIFTKIQLLAGWYVYLGETVAADPTAVAGAYLVRQTFMVPSLRTSRREYSCRI